MIFFPISWHKLSIPSLSVVLSKCSIPVVYIYCLLFQMISNPYLVNTKAVSLYTKAGENILKVPCPYSSTLQPCECSNASRIILCGPSVDSSSGLPYPFRDAAQQIHQNLETLSSVNSEPSTAFNEYSYRSHSRDQPEKETLSFKVTGNEWFDFESLHIDGTSLEKIVSQTFQSFVFHSLIIRNNYYLTNFENEAFYPSHNFITILRFENNQKLGSTQESVKTVFDTIRTFKKLEQAIITGCGLNYLPPYAFGSTKHMTLPNLKRIVLSQNKLTTIYPNSFFGLPAIRLIDLRHNQIRDLQPDSFHFMKPSPVCSRDARFQMAAHYKIDVSNNRIEVPGVHSEAVSASGCSVELNLSNNSISGGLEESHFRGLFANDIRISLYGNALECTNCDNWWLLKSRECSSGGTYLKYYFLLESSCTSNVFSLHRFVKCPSITRELEKKNQAHLLNVPAFELAYRLRTVIPDILEEKNASLLHCSKNGDSVAKHSDPEFNGNHSASVPFFVLFLFTFFLQFLY